MADNETIADIIAEKRLRAAEMEKTLGDQHPFVKSLKNDADRLDAALRREQSQSWHHREMEELVLRHEKELVDAKKSSGNAAKLREALEKVRHLMPYFLQYMRLRWEDAGGGGYYESINKTIDAALSAPPRNCDRPECATTKAAQDVWRREDGGKTAYYEWLLATTTEGGKNGNE